MVRLVRDAAADEGLRLDWAFVRGDWSPPSSARPMLVALVAMPCTPSYTAPPMRVLKHRTRRPVISPCPSQVCAVWQRGRRLLPLVEFEATVRTALQVWLRRPSNGSCVPRTSPAWLARARVGRVRCAHCRHDLSVRPAALCTGRWPRLPLLLLFRWAAAFHWCPSTTRLCGCAPPPPVARRSLHAWTIPSEPPVCRRRDSRRRRG